MIKRCQGFSLLEVLVAFTILGISLGVLFQIFSTGLQAAKLSEEYAYATVLAKSRLATIGVTVPYEEGVEEGIFNDKYAWRTTILPYEITEETAVIPLEGAANKARINEGFETITNPPVFLYQVIVEVFWKTADRKRSVVLKTLRLVPK